MTAMGELLYVGEIDFVRGDLTVTYTAASTGVNFRASDFRTLLGTASGEAITSVSFTPPTTGTLYYNYVNGRGTPSPLPTSSTPPAPPSASTI